MGRGGVVELFIVSSCLEWRDDDKMAGEGTRVMVGLNGFIQILGFRLCPYWEKFIRKYYHSPSTI